MDDYIAKLFLFIRLSLIVLIGFLNRKNIWWSNKIRNFGKEGIVLFSHGFLFTLIT